MTLTIAAANKIAREMTGNDVHIERNDVAPDLWAVCGRGRTQGHEPMDAASLRGLLRDEFRDEDV